MHNARVQPENIISPMVCILRHIDLAHSLELLERVTVGRYRACAADRGDGNLANVQIAFCVYGNGVRSEEASWGTAFLTSKMR